MKMINRLQCTKSSSSATERRVIYHTAPLSPSLAVHYLGFSERPWGKYGWRNRREQDKREKKTCWRKKAAVRHWMWLGRLEKVTGRLLVGKPTPSSRLASLSPASLRVKLSATVTQRLNMKQFFTIWCIITVPAAWFRNCCKQPFVAHLI